VSAAGPYSRCPDCRFIAPPESMDYALTGPPPDSGIDWSRPVHVTCMICHAHHDITAADVVQAGAVMSCKRCAAPVAYPAGAARVRCTGCGLFLLGPDLDDAQREELRITRGRACWCP
jgi:LSD1 subclass zinc finger protein